MPNPALIPNPESQKNAKHSPGPWRQPQPWQVEISHSAPEAPNCIVKIELPLGHVADARLIAAAPDLLEMLREIVAAEKHHEGEDSEPAWYEDATAAIAKAEGGAA